MFVNKLKVMKLQNDLHYQVKVEFFKLEEKQKFFT